MEIIQHCKTCGARPKDSTKCGIFGHQVNIDEDFCSHHTSYIETCEICGRSMLPGSCLVSLGSSGRNRYICPSCNNLFATCAICSSGTYCAFNEDPSPIPKTIQKRIQQGYMTAITEVMNPERIVATCINQNCKCYNAIEKKCMRDNNICGGYHEKED